MVILESSADSGPQCQRYTIVSAVPEVDLQPIIGGSAESNEMFVVSHNERSLANRQNVRAAWNDVSPWSAKTGTMFTKQVSSNEASTRIPAGSCQAFFGHPIAVALTQNLGQSWKRRLIVLQSVEGPVLLVRDLHAQGPESIHQAIVSKTIVTSPAIRHQDADLTRL